MGAVTAPLVTTVDFHLYRIRVHRDWHLVIDTIVTFSSLILDSSHHQNSGKYTLPHLCDLLVCPGPCGRQGKANKKFL